MVSWKTQPWYDYKASIRLVINSKWTKQEYSKNYSREKLADVRQSKVKEKMNDERIKGHGQRAKIVQGKFWKKQNAAKKKM